MLTFNVPTDKFTINLTGDTTGMKWEGDFRTKLSLSCNDTFAIERIIMEKTGGYALDKLNNQNYALFIGALAQLQVRLVNAPDWWMGGWDHLDWNLISEVYKETQQKIDKYLDEQNKKTEQLRQKMSMENSGK
jgi:hypothetical protein